MQERARQEARSIEADRLFSSIILWEINDETLERRRLHNETIHFVKEMLAAAAE